MHDAASIRSVVVTSARPLDQKWGFLLLAVDGGSSVHFPKLPFTGFSSLSPQAFTLPYPRPDPKSRLGPNKHRHDSLQGLQDVSF
jgi:hypothetical protein